MVGKFGAINLEVSAGDDLMTLELTSLQAVVSKEDKTCLTSTRRDCSTSVGGRAWLGGGRNISHSATGNEKSSA